MARRYLKLLLLALAAPLPFLLTATAYAQAQFTSVDHGGNIICAITTEGAGVCNSAFNSDVVMSAEDLPNIIDIAAGSESACAITESGDINCFGRISFGLLNPPTAGAPYSSLSMSISHACAINSSNGIDCWGLADNDRLNPPPGTYQQVSVSVQQACAVDFDGGVACWGSNDQGTTDVPADLPAAMQVSAGFASSCALLLDGSTQCWGRLLPSQSGPFTAIESFASGTGNSGTSGICGLTGDGGIQCVAARFVDNQPVPFVVNDVPSENGFTDITSSGTAYCAINSEGEIDCFGTLLPTDAPGSTSIDSVPTTTGLRIETYSESTVELFWDSPPAAFRVAGHEIQRNGEVVVFTQNLSSFIFDDLVPGEVTTFAVRQVSVEGNVGAFSDSVDVTTGATTGPDPSGFQPPERPFEPTGLEAFVFGDTTVELVWDRVFTPLVTGYEIRRDGEFIGFTAGTSFLDGVPSASGVLYRYDVIPVNQNDPSLFLGFTSISVGVGGAEPGVCL